MRPLGFTIFCLLYLVMALCLFMLYFLSVCTTQFSIVLCLAPLVIHGACTLRGDIERRIMCMVFLVKLGCPELVLI